MTSTTHHKIGVAMATIIGMNAMIGASVFLIPERLHQTVGPAAIITYFLVIFAAWTIAYSLARVAAHYKQEGSFYTYIQAWAGKKAGIIGALSYTIGLTVALGLLTRMTGIYMHTLWPRFSEFTLATGALALLTLSLLAGARILKGGQILLIILTLVPLAIITVLGFLKADLANLTPFFPYGKGAVLDATKIVIFGFFGFEAIASLHTVMKDPKHTVPRAITASIIAVSLVYMTFVIATILGIPRDLVLQGGTLPDFLYKLFPGHSWFITLVAAGMTVTIMGTIHSMLWSVAALLQSITQRAGTRITLTFNQAIIIMSLCVWASTLLFKNIGLFFDITAIFIILAYAGALWPLAAGLIPASRWDKIIAICGLISSGIMCGYALSGIAKYIFG